MDLCGSIMIYLDLYLDLCGSILIGKACHSSCLTLETNRENRHWGDDLIDFPLKHADCWFQSWLSGLQTPRFLRWFHVGYIYLSNKVASFGFIEKMDGIPKGQFWYALCRRPCLLGEQKEHMWPWWANMPSQSQLRPLRSLFGEQ